MESGVFVLFCFLMACPLIFLQNYLESTVIEHRWRHLEWHFRKCSRRNIGFWSSPYWSLLLSPNLSISISNPGTLTSFISKVLCLLEHKVLYNTPKSFHGLFTIFKTFFINVTCKSPHIPSPTAHTIDSQQDLPIFLS